MYVVCLYVCMYACLVGIYCSMVLYTSSHEVEMVLTAAGVTDLESGNGNREAQVSSVFFMHATFLSAPARPHCMYVCMYVCTVCMYYVNMILVQLMDTW